MANSQPTTELPAPGTLVPRRATLNRNPSLLIRGALIGKTVRRHPELGLLAAVKISTYTGIEAQISQQDERPIDALLAWFELLDRPEFRVRQAHVEGVRLEVSGLLEDVPARAWALLSSPSAVALLGTEAPTVHTLRCLQIEGAR